MIFDFTIKESSRSGGFFYLFLEGDVSVDRGIYPNDASIVEIKNIVYEKVSTYNNSGAYLGFVRQ